MLHRGSNYLLVWEMSFIVVAIMDMVCGHQCLVAVVTVAANDHHVAITVYGLHCPTRANQLLLLTL